MSDPQKEHVPFTREDQELLIRMDEKISGLIKRVEQLTNDHEFRLRFLERWVWTAVGALTIIDIVVIYVLSKH